MNTNIMTFSCAAETTSFVCSFSTSILAWFTWRIPKVLKLSSVGGPRVLLSSRRLMMIKLPCNTFCWIEHDPVSSTPRDWFRIENRGSRDVSQQGPTTSTRMACDTSRSKENNPTPSLCTTISLRVEQRSDNDSVIMDCGIQQDVCRQIWTWHQCADTNR